MNKNMIIKISDVLGTLIIVFSCFYLKDTLLNPIYVVFIFVILLFFMFFLTSHSNLCLSTSSIITLAYIVYIIVSNVAMGEITSACYNVLFSLAYYELCVFILHFLNKEQLKKTCNIFFLITALLFSFDAYYRFMNPVIKPAYVGLLYFQRFKSSSVMYEDSNFVGISAIVVYFLCMYIQSRENINLKKIQIILFILCILTLSRSVIISVIAFTIVFSSSITKKTKIWLACLAGVVFVYLFFNYFLNDYSFNSKFYIIRQAIEFFSEASFTQQMFGVGLGKSMDYLGIGAHNFVVTYIIETGIIGVLFLTVLWFQIFIESHKKITMVMLPFLVAGFSMAQHFLPFLYCAYAIIICFENNRNEKICV